MTREMTLVDVINHVQHFTRHWPEPLRYPEQAALAQNDSDKGFERLLRNSLELRCPVGDIAPQRDLGLGGGRVGAVVPQHELDLIVRTTNGPFVVEAKAWQGEVDKDVVIVFLGKVMDFLAAATYEPIEHLSCGFISVAGFSEAALRLTFAFGVVPFTQRADQIPFRHLDSLLAKAVHESCANGWPETAEDLTFHRAALIQHIAHEGSSLTDIFHRDQDVAIVDLDGIRRASDMFDESRSAHAQALEAYRAFRQKEPERRA